MLNESFAKPRGLPKKDPNSVKDYLNSIKFEERLERREVTAVEMKEILLEYLKKYFQGKVNLEFILTLSEEISGVWWEASELEEDDVLGTVACEFRYLLPLSTIPKRPSKKIKETLHWTLEVLEKDLNKSKIEQQK